MVDAAGAGKRDGMRYESSVTSLSWIPSEAIEGGTRLAFDAGFTHYDDPPPAELGDLEELRAADRFRFGNVLRAWIEVDSSGGITDCGYAGGGMIGCTTVRLGGLQHSFQAVQLPDLQRDPERGDGWARFVQVCGGRTDFREWYRKSFGRHSPWGDEDSPVLVTAVETALERSLSVQLMHGGAKPRIERFPAAAALVGQGDRGTDVYLVLDGVIRVERDGERLAEYGPGALLGERAHLGGGLRTSSLVAVTPCRVAAVDASQLDRSALEELSGGHRREDVTGL